MRVRKPDREWRSILLYLAIVMALVVAACGGDDTTDTTVGGDEATTTSAAADTGTTAAGDTDTTVAATTTTSGELDDVKGTYSPIAAYAPLFVAMEEGIFEKWGINNTMDQVRINEALPLVANGDYDWGRSENSPGWFNALNSDLDLYGVVDRLTYTCSADNSLSVSTSLYEEGVDTFAELEGRTIGIIAPGTQAEYWLAQLLEENDMTLEDVNVVYLGYSDQLAGMASGTIDAAFMLEPLLTQGVQAGDITPILSMLEVTPGANIGTMFFGGHFIDRDGGDVAVRWVAAWLEAARFAQDPANKDAVLSAVQKWTEMEMAELEAIYDGRTTWPQVNPNGRVDVDEVLATQGQFMLDGEFIDALPPAERVFNGEIVEGALEMIGEVDAEEVQLCS
jgi:NitT/TauT family transport system substrate-binding protein